jgi:hypothetical protein
MHKVVGMLFPNIFNAEIIDNEGEGDWSPFVAPEAWSVRALMISVGGESFPEEFVGKYACLWQSSDCSFQT